MARMQHYDGATRLLDVASSLDVALCFASSRHDEVTGVVYSYRVNLDMRVSIGEQSDGQEPETDRCRGGRPLLVMPWGYEPRIVAQHGAFIMTSLDGSLADSNLFHELGGRLRGSSDLDSPKAEAFRGKVPGGKVMRSRGFAAADPGARLHLPASVVEVHVAARRLRRIVPLGICPNGTIRLRGERPFSSSTRPFELSSGVFYYAQSGCRDSPAQYAVRSAIGNIENCRSSQ